MHLSVASSLDEVPEKRMRGGGATLEFRVGLAGHEPGMVWQLYHLHQTAVGRGARNHQPCLFQGVPIGVAHLETVAMALGNVRRALSLQRLGALFQHAGVGPQPHGAPLVLDVGLVGHEVYHLGGSALVELG